VNKITQLWQQTTPEEIKVNGGTRLKSVAYADNLVPRTTPEDDVQRPVKTLSRVLRLYNMKILEAKTESMGLQGI
jgi:hypothetical protein